MGRGKTREVSGVRQREEANVFISWWGWTLHLPLRSVVMDRVTWGALKGGILIQRKRKSIYVRKRRGRNKSERQRSGREEEEGDLVSVRRGMSKGGKVETG